MVGGTDGLVPSRSGFVVPGRNCGCSYGRRVVLRRRGSLLHFGRTAEGVPGVRRRDVDAHGGDFSRCAPDVAHYTPGLAWRLDHRIVIHPGCAAFPRLSLALRDISWN